MVGWPTLTGMLPDDEPHMPFDLVTRERRHMNISSDLWRAVLESTGQGDLRGMQPEE